MKIKATQIERSDSKAGHIRVLLSVIDQTIEEQTKILVMQREDTRLYQGYVQALLAIKEFLS